MIATIKDAESLSRQLAALSKTARAEMVKQLEPIAALLFDKDPLKRAKYYAAAQEIFVSLAGKYGAAAQAVAYDALEQQKIQVKDASPVPLNAGGVMNKAIHATAAQTQPYLLGALDLAVKRGYRSTVERNAERWARVPVGSYTCPFCVMLASRGFVYTAKTAKSSSQYHAHCDCALVPYGKSGKAKLDGYDPDALYEKYKKGEGIGERPEGKPAYTTGGAPIGGGGSGGSGSGGSGGGDIGAFGGGNGRRGDSTERFPWSGHTIDVSKARHEGRTRVRIDSNDGKPPTNIISRLESFSMQGSEGIDMRTITFGGKVEKETAAWAIANYGGNLAFVPRDPPNMTPDYIWSGEKWEQKSASSINGIEKRLKKAAKQTDHGSVILDVSTYHEGDMVLLAKVGLEMKLQGLQKVIIRSGDSAIDILETA
jgi:uncharacterized membrane protein YgcG